MNYIELQQKISEIKKTFIAFLCDSLRLIEVESPLFLKTEECLNDGLNGEASIKFNTSDFNQYEIIHSLAKWKRIILSKHNFDLHTGIVANMKAIRPFEKLDDLHSYLVDQWDWEIVISEKNRNYKYLKYIVSLIYECIKKTELQLGLNVTLPESLTFITSQELEDIYPHLSPSQREYEITKKWGAVFISQIGCDLKSGKPHDTRAEDYDDWELNGDIIFFSDLLNAPIEISSMGIRVNAASLNSQLTQLPNKYHMKIFNNELVNSIGGGIGQSRLAMYLLNIPTISVVQG